MAIRKGCSTTLIAMRGDTGRWSSLRFRRHDMQSNNGLYKVNIFDPEPETLDPMARTLYESRLGQRSIRLAAFHKQPERTVLSGLRSKKSAEHTAFGAIRSEVFALVSICDTASEWHGAGGWRIRSEQTYHLIQIALRKVFRISLRLTLRLRRVALIKSWLKCTTRIRIEHFALENARMAFPLYPQLEVQTGPRMIGWSARSMGRRSMDPELIPGGARFGVGGGTPEFTKGNTWCLNVLAALKDPNRNAPQERWALVDGFEVRRTAARPQA